MPGIRRQIPAPSRVTAEDPSLGHQDPRRADRGADRSLERPVRLKSFSATILRLSL